MESYRVVPWADWSEWIELKKLLSDGNFKQANEIIAMYRTRRNNSVPLTILVTSSLVTLLENPYPDAYVQRLSLSMAIVRFVNGTTDRLQPRGDTSSARSVLSLAYELGLPLTLVDIRHQASHNILPRLETLTSGAKQALSWIATHYWGPQEENIKAGLGNRRDGSRKTPGPEKEKRDLANSKTKSASEKPESAITMKRERIEELETKTTFKKRRKRWELCENRDEWKNLPLGLAPGQKCVPRSVTTIPLGTPPKSREKASSSIILSSPSPGKNNGMHGLGAPIGKETGDTVQPKRLESPEKQQPKDVSTKDQAFVQDKRNEFELVASLTTPADS